MKNENSIRITTLLAVAALASAGCQTQKMMRTSARNAADQLLAVKLEVQSKALAEADFYRQEREAMSEALHRARLDDFELLLKEQAETFAASYAAGPTADDIETFLTEFVAAWQAKDQEREAALQSVADELDQVEITLDERSAEIDALVKKLRVLSEAETKGQLARFAAGYIDAAYREYQAVKEAAE